MFVYSADQVPVFAQSSVVSVRKVAGRPPSPDIRALLLPLDCVRHPTPAAAMLWPAPSVTLDLPVMQPSRLLKGPDRVVFPGSPWCRDAPMEQLCASWWACLAAMPCTWGAAGSPPRVPLTKQSPGPGAVESSISYRSFATMPKQSARRGTRESTHRSSSAHRKDPSPTAGTVARESPRASGCNSLAALGRAASRSAQPGNIPSKESAGQHGRAT